MNQGKTARWKLYEVNGRIRLPVSGYPYVCCSLCGGSVHEATPLAKGKIKFCYECGAKMDTSDSKPGEYND